VCEIAVAEPRTDLRRNARLVLAAFLATLAYGLLLTIAFEPDVQQADAAELVDRADDARAFLIADLFFPLLFGLLVPLALLRFGASLSRREGGGSGPPRWIVAAAASLAVSGIFDWAENALLLSATGSESEGAVDAAHLVAIPKIAFFVVGAALSLLALARAIGVLRGGSGSPPPQPG